MFPLALHNVVHQIGTTNTGGRGPSPRLWSRFNGRTSSPDGGDQAVGLFDDFLSFGGSVATNVGTKSGQAGGYKTYEDTGCSILQRAIGTYEGGAGVIRFETDATDNQSCDLVSGYEVGTLGAISDTAGDDFMLAFECRVKYTQVTDTYNFFIGLTEEGLSADNGLISDAGALADKDMIGFAVLEDDGDALDIVYNKESGGGVTTHISAAQALTAATWYKLGFVYDPLAPASKRITFYIDNVEQSTYITGTNIAAATFPDAQGLLFMACLKNQTNVAKTVDLDWWAFGMTTLASS